jgi:N-formylglutamate amidohydrolase
MQIPGVPNRTAGTTTQDARTSELTEAVANRLTMILCERPYVVIAQFHRRYLDVNRPEPDAYEHPDARPHYLAYHQAIRRFVSEIKDRYPDGAILVDIHGQPEEASRIHRGTNNGRSVARLLDWYGDDALVGPTSIFGQLRADGYDVYPPNGPLRDAREDPRWNGGHTVSTYGSQHPDGLDAVQVEIGRDWRQSDTITRMADRLANAIAVFYTTYLSQLRRCA